MRGNSNVFDDDGFFWSSTIATHTGNYRVQLAAPPPPNRK